MRHTAQGTFCTAGADGSVPTPWHLLLLHLVRRTTTLYRLKLGEIVTTIPTM